MPSPHLLWINIRIREYAFCGFISIRHIKEFSPKAMDWECKSHSHLKGGEGDLLSADSLVLDV
jgi:hypothetical protein